MAYQSLPPPLLTTTHKQGNTVMFQGTQSSPPITTTDSPVTSGETTTGTGTTYDTTPPLEDPPLQDSPLPLPPMHCIAVSELILKHRDIFKVITTSSSVGPILRGEQTAFNINIPINKGDFIHFVLKDPLEVHDTEILTSFYRAIGQVTYSRIRNTAGESLFCFRLLPMCCYLSSQDSHNPLKTKEDCITYPACNPPWHN